MKNILLLFLTLLYSRSSFAQNWESLFDGKTLNDWSILDKPANVQVKDSLIVLHMTPYTARHAFVRSNKKFENFIFEVDFRRDLILDSGVLFRSIDAPDTAYSAIFGYMVKIDPQVTRKWTGGILTDYGNGFQWLHSLENNESSRKAEKNQGEWNTLRLQAEGQNIKVWLNGVPTVNLIDDKYKKGYIAFKIHYLASEVEKKGLEIAFKNPRIITKDLKKYMLPNDLPLKDTRGIFKVSYFR
jgi:hypothetical protein